MTTQDVYKQFGIPKNLQHHMVTVTGLICSIKEHWVGDEISWDTLITAGLIHDLGNVIKFDLDKFPHLLGDELPRIDFWREQQKKLIAKYGNDDHEATGKMLDELGVGLAIKETILAKSFSNIRDTAASSNWLPKILQYCDLRASPYGLMTLDERVNDIKERYDKYAGRLDFSEMIKASNSIEGDIARSVDTELDNIITVVNANKHKDMLLTYSIKS